MPRNRTRAAVLSVVGSVVFIYASVCALLYFAQRSLLYFPVPGGQPAGAESIAIASGGETLRIWSQPQRGAAAVIYFGGNAEDVSGNFGSFASALPGHAVYLVNYRGYGGSSGAPSEQALFADALTVYDWAHARHANVVVIGRSLGSGVAVHVASERPVERLVLVTPYDSIENVARGHYPLFPVSWLLKDRFDSVSRVAGVRASTLAILAEHDEVIPRRRSEALIARFPARQIRVEVIRGSHNTVGDSPRYLDLIAAFLS